MDRLFNYFTGKIDLNQRIPLLQMLSSHQAKSKKRSICWWVLTPCPMRYALCVLLNTDGEFDEEDRAVGFVVPHPDISIVI